jgi:hypothetical protein
VFERLNALTNPKRPLTQDNFYTTAIFTSLPQDWLPCVLHLMNKPYVASSRVIAALKQEGLHRKARAEVILDSTTASSAKTKRSRGGGGNQNGVPSAMSMAMISTRASTRPESSKKPRHDFIRTLTPKATPLTLTQRRAVNLHPNQRLKRAGLW